MHGLFGSPSSRPLLVALLGLFRSHVLRKPPKCCRIKSLHERFTSAVIWRNEDGSQENFLAVVHCAAWALTMTSLIFPATHDARAATSC